MPTWKRRLLFCLRHGVPLALLLVLAWLLYVILGPQPRWSMAGKIQSAAFAPNSQWVVLQTDEPRTFQITSVDTGETTFHTETWEWPSRNYATSIDDRYLVVHIDADTFRFFEFKSGRQFDIAVPMKEHDRHRCAMHALGSLCVIEQHYNGPGLYPGAGRSNHDGPPRPWEVCLAVVESATGKVVLRSSGPRRFFKATPNGELIFVFEGEEQSLVEIWTFGPEPQVRRFPGLTAEDLSKDGSTLLVVNRWNEFSTLDIARGELRPCSQVVDGQPTPIVKPEVNWIRHDRLPVITSFAWPSQPSFWDSGAWEKANAAWEKAKEIRSRLPEADLAISSCGGWALTGERFDPGKKGRVKLWNTSTGGLLFSEEGFDEPWYYHEFTRKHLLLSFDGSLWHGGPAQAMFVDLSTGTVSYQGKVFRSPPSHVAIESHLPGFIRDALKKVGASVPRQWRVTEPDSGRVILDFSTPHLLTDVALAKDEQSVLTLEDAGPLGQVLKVWDIPAQRPWAWIVGPPLALAGLLYAFRWWRRRRLVKRATPALTN